jgi:hypothetical protein
MKARFGVDFTAFIEVWGVARKKEERGSSF